MTHVFQANPTLLERMQDIINELEKDHVAARDFYAPTLWVDQVAKHPTDAPRVAQHLVYGRLAIVVADSDKGRSALNQLVRIFGETGTPVPFVFRNVIPACDDMVLYDDTKPHHNARAQSNVISYVLEASPVEFDHYINQTQDGRPVLPSDYHTAYGRIEQYETEDGLGMTIPLLLPKMSVETVVSLLAHVVDTNAQEDLTYVGWSMTDASQKKALSRVTYETAHVLYGGTWCEDTLAALDTCEPIASTLSDDDLPF